MNIIVDVREKRLIDILKEEYPDINVMSKALPLGDILIQDNNGQDLALFERKSLNDLLSSITDGRYEEQSFRLQQCELSNHRIYYLIEGYIGNYKSRGGLYSPNTIYSCVYSLSYVKGFSVLNPGSIVETAEIIAKFAKKLFTDPPSSEEKTYLDSVKLTKKSNMTDAVVQSLMLAQIPGVSKNMASILLKEYTNVRGLINALENDENCLNDFKYEIANNKQRKLSKTCVANLKKYLLTIEE